jgi:hypothetical protein
MPIKETQAISMLSSLLSKWRYPESEDPQSVPQPSVGNIDMD